MDSYKRNLIQLVAVVSSIFFIGTLGYYFIEDGWTLFDAFYMVAISITTVGYGETHELSNAGRVFSIFLIFLGLGVAAAFATRIARFVVEGELKGIYGRKKMQNKINKMNKHYVVCGHGRTGNTICLKLFELGIPFVVVESDRERRELAEHRGYLTIDGDGTNDIALINAGIERASGIVICMSEDTKTLVISLAARELNSEIHIIAQGSDPNIETRIKRSGANAVVYPIKLGGEQIARLIAQQYGISSAVERRIHDPGIMGYYLRIFKLFDDRNITISEALTKADALYAVALKTGDGEIHEMPSRDMEITKNDSLVMLVKKIKNIPQPDVSQKEIGITWSDNLSIGIPVIDEEHRSLVLLANEFQLALSEGHGTEKVAIVFDKLLEYTAKHFKNEEEYMEKNSYPNIEEHKAEHLDLVNQVMELNKDKRYVFPENISEFLSSWLKEHIMGSDKEFGIFLNKQGIK